jgi:hypothetical protein
MAAAAKKSDTEDVAQVMSPLKCPHSRFHVASCHAFCFCLPAISFFSILSPSLLPLLTRSIFYWSDTLFSWQVLDCWRVPAFALIFDHTLDISENFSFRVGYGTRVLDTFSALLVLLSSIYVSFFFYSAHFFHMYRNNGLISTKVFLEDILLNLPSALEMESHSPKKETKGEVSVQRTKWTPLKPLAALRIEILSKHMHVRAGIISGFSPSLLIFNNYWNDLFGSSTNTVLGRLMLILEIGSKILKYIHVGNFQHGIMKTQIVCINKLLLL